MKRGGNRRRGPVPALVAAAHAGLPRRPSASAAPAASGSPGAARQNTLLCQFAVQEVEPILSPEQLAVGTTYVGAPNTCAVDRLLRQRVVCAPRSRRLRRARRARSASSPHARGDRGERRGIGDVALLRPARAHERAGERRAPRASPRSRAARIQSRARSPSTRTNFGCRLSGMPRNSRQRCKLDQPIRLPLRRALRERQAARHREHLRRDRSASRRSSRRASRASATKRSWPRYVHGETGVEVVVDRFASCRVVACPAAFRP